eukprot:scaffold29732_cov36-Tisochrysis_lutea.AAC.4
MYAGRGRAEGRREKTAGGWDGRWVSAGNPGVGWRCGADEWRRAALADGSAERRPPSPRPRAAVTRIQGCSRSWWHGIASCGRRKIFP